MRKLFLTVSLLLATTGPLHADDDWDWDNE
jgi:hypothetical protein